MSSLVKKFFVGLIFFLTVAGIFALPTSRYSMDRCSIGRYSIDRYFFEIFRYDITGLSILEDEAEIAKGKELRKFADSILVRPIYYLDGCIKKGIVADLFFKDASSILYSTFDRDDLFPAVTEGKDSLENAKIDWVDEVLLSLNYEIVPYVPKDVDISNEAETSETSDSSEISEGGDGTEGAGENGSGTEGEGKNEKKEATPPPPPTEEREFFKKDGRLRKFTFGDEVFSGGELNEDGKRIVVSVVGNNMKRKILNEEYLLLNVENWETGSKARDTTLKSKKEYFYDENTKNVTKSVEKIFKAKSVALLSEIKDANFEKEIEMTFDENGRTSGQKVYHYEIEGEKKDAASKTDGATQTAPNASADPAPEKVKKLIDEIENWKYDEEGRVTEEKKLLYKYSKTAKGKDLTEKSESRTVYTYTEKSPSPDSRFYENKHLRIETVYANADNYTQRMYFDDKMMLVLKFERGIKKSEALYSGTHLVRERSFE